MPSGKRATAGYRISSSTEPNRPALATLAALS